MAGYQLKLKERRMSERKRLTGLMPGRFQVEGKDVSARPVDISEHGLGILIDREFKEGTTATLLLKDSSVAFEVMWVQQDFGKHDLWRYGLVCKDQKLNLISLFADTGCLK